MQLADESGSYKHQFVYSNTILLLITIQDIEGVGYQFPYIVDLGRTERAWHKLLYSPYSHYRHLIIYKAKIQRVYIEDSTFRIPNL